MYDSRVDTMIKCDNCWKRLSQPTGWTRPDLELARDDSDDNSDDDKDKDESDQEVNSEEECFELPTITPATSSSASSANTTPAADQDDMVLG